MAPIVGRTSTAKGWWVGGGGLEGGSGRELIGRSGFRQRGAVGGWFMGVRGWVWTGLGVGLVRLRWCRGLPGRRGLGCLGCPSRGFGFFRFVRGCG